MKKILFVLPVLAFLLINCGGAPRDPQSPETVAAEETLTFEERAFLNNLASLCGQSFRGRQTYMQEGRESWEGRDMVMHVTVCEETHVHIPFHMDEDQSRTWMFLVEDGRLRFRHDHRYPDGTPEEQTLYGGYSDRTGTAFKQKFPADEYTIALLTDTLNREWNVVLEEDMSNFSYRLLYHGEIVFQADFDLTMPL